MKNKLIWVFFFCCHVAFAQNEVSTIYWGTTIFDFRSYPYHIVSSSAVNSKECAASICDAQGNLLFYSNGGTSPLALNQVAGAWGANGQFLQNGQSLTQLGCLSSQQGAIILPDPAGISATSKKYYLITRDCVESAVMGAQSSNSGLSYGVIDMLANGGNGSVISQNNVVVPYDYTQGHASNREPLNVVLDSDGNQKSGEMGYWIYSYTGDSLYKIHFGVNGFDSFQKLFKETGRIIVSPDRKHLMIHGRLYSVEAQSGDLELVHTFSTTDYGAFSPDGRKIYRMESSVLKQYNLDMINWESNAYDVATIQSTASLFPLLMPSGSIFIQASATQIDAQVVCPNNVGSACGFDPADLPLQGGTVAGMPNIPAHYLYKSGYNCNLSLDEHSTNTWSVFPNPSNEFIQLTGLAAPTDYTIFSVDGKRVGKGTTTNNERILLAHLSKGMYRIEVLGQIRNFVVE